MITVKIFKVTNLQTNCCFLKDEETGAAAVADPGAKSESLIEEINKNGGRLEYVMLTHGHYDHIGYAKELADSFGAKIITGEKNAEFLKNSEYNHSIFHGEAIPEFSADILLKDGDTFMLGNTEIKYITTPGHTTGCGAFIFDNTVLSGDTLFCESYGRTDLPTGNDEMMIQSLLKLKNLDGDYRVIPGHGELTTLEHERKYNPLMRRL
ncbi:MAG: MBL fold metallo-hydrolase [Clostridiales bacterium]|nr:MBL fold metallo-hydrolase [Clostridiales bacterium]